ncbi:MAG TPA: SAM-dependent methyltransferase, partial [Bacteroidales bacterium]|nr:SAM-dependent methyltransferase [Bacteroidales bacterium]
MKSPLPAILYLLPSPLGGDEVQSVLPELNLQIIRRLRRFIVEDVRSARRFLRKAGVEGPLDDELFLLLNEHTRDEEIPELLTPLRQGMDTGLMSEAGLPCVADPGHRVVQEAHRLNIRVTPLTGPSSLMLALMASGLNGQSFHFHGYLPVKPAERKAYLKKLEKEVQASGATQIFIETPYRNGRMLEDILTTVHPATMLCIATDLTLPGESIKTLTIAEWKGKKPGPDKRNTVFLL